MDTREQKHRILAAQMLECALLTGDASAVRRVIQQYIDTLPPLSLEALIEELQAIMAAYRVLLSSLDLLTAAENPRYIGLRYLLRQVLIRKGRM